MDTHLLNRLKNLSLTLPGLVLVTLLSACSEGAHDKSFTINNPDAQEKLVAELKKRQIPYRLDETGRMWYAEEHNVAVYELAYEIMGRSEPTRTTYAYDDPKYTEMFIARLRTADVPFRLTVNQDVTYVVLEMEHESLWLPIKKEIDDKWDADVTEKFRKAEIE